MRPIEPTRPNKFIAAAEFGALIAIAVLRLSGAHSNEFRFEDYTGDKFGSQDKGYEAAKAHLYRLFPKGSQPGRLAAYKEYIGGECFENKTLNYRRIHGNALYCRYSHWIPELIIGSSVWSVHIYREDNENEISKIEIKMRIDAL